VDVRDVADAHVKALAVPEAAGQRLICSGDEASIADIASILARHFSARGYRITQRRLPSWAIRLVGLFDRSVQMVVGELGQSCHFDTSRIRSVLAWHPRPLQEMVVAMGESMITHGVV